jgi:hypothetical protein
MTYQQSFVPAEKAASTKEVESSVQSEIELIPVELDPLTKFMAVSTAEMLEMFGLPEAESMPW